MPSSKKRPTRKFKSPELNKPIAITKSTLVPPPGALDNEEVMQAWLARKKDKAEAESHTRAVEKFRRFLLLVDEYDIPKPVTEDGWMLLASKLAYDFVPGLQVIESEEQLPRHIERDTELYFVVRELMQKPPGMSAKSACVSLNRKKPWSSIGAGALYNNYRAAAKSPMVITLLALERRLETTLSSAAVKSAMAISVDRKK